MVEDITLAQGVRDARTKLWAAIEDYAKRRNDLPVLEAMARYEVAVKRRYQLVERAVPNEEA